MSIWCDFKTGRFSIVPILVRVFLLNVVRCIQTTQMRTCIRPTADYCFERLFENMPICSESELTFRCHHFKALDNCFRESKLICAPSVIGQIAKLTYQKRLVECARQTQKKYRDVPNHLKSTPTILRYHPPSELQFISLFGYLQTQCTTKPHANCSNEDYKQMTTSCEADIRKQRINSDLERHQLLRLKLDTSSRLLSYPETQRSEECLIVRAGLSQIFELHKKYCLQSIVTRCMCEQLNFEYLCDIGCANLELTTLNFDQKVSWAEFKGQLVGSRADRIRGLFEILNSMIVYFFVIKLF